MPWYYYTSTLLALTLQYPVRSVSTATVTICILAAANEDVAKFNLKINRGKEEMECLH